MINYHHQRSPACHNTACRYRYARHRAVDGENRSGDGRDRPYRRYWFSGYCWKGYRTGLIHHQLHRLALEEMEMVKQAKEQSAGCVGRGRTMARTIGAWITIRVSRAVSSATDLVGFVWFHWTTRSELARQRRALKHMPDWQLEDLGLCRAAARAEAMRPVWLARLPQIAPYQRGQWGQQGQWGQRGNRGQRRRMPVGDDCRCHSAPPPL